MKKIITLFSACFLFFISQAQITLTENDMAKPLTRYIRYNDTLPTLVTPGAAGANQTWNFTSLDNHTTDTILFTKPEWTAYGTSFPASNLCMMTINTGTSCMYMNLNSDSLNVVGQAGKFAGSTTDILIPFDPTQKIADLPSTYQDGFTNTSSFTLTQYYGQYGIDSVKIIDTINTQSEFDAWGGITTVIGTYNAIRSKVTDITDTKIWGLMAGTWTDITTLAGGGLDTTKRYGWWAKDLGYMILEMEVDPITDSVIDIKYLGALPQPGGLTHYVKNDVISVYPNPASGMVFVSTPENTFTVEVFNTSGKLINSSKANNMISNIDISGLPSGAYIIRIYGNDGITICHKNLIVE